MGRFVMALMSVNKVKKEISMEIVNVKGTGRGRPRKMVKLDDGSMISYAEYKKLHPELKAKAVVEVPTTPAQA